MDAKSVGAAKEVLEAIGQKSEKEGIKWTKYFMDKFDKKEWEKDQFNISKIKKLRRFKNEYFRMLGRMLRELLDGIDKPDSSFRTSVYCNDIGVVAQFKDIIGNTYQKAFKPCGIPKIDYHAVKTVAGMAEDKMYDLSDATQTPGGVFLK